MNIQKELNYSISRCRLADDEITACGYHLDRVSSTVFGIRTNALQPTGTHTAILKYDADIKRLAELFRDRRDPAGGWYLVKEQREWLEKRLTDVFKNFDAAHSPVRILESGAASLNHHYSYLKIIKNALDACGKDLKVTLSVVDLCPFPIQQINFVERELNEGLMNPKVVSVKGIKVPVSRELLELVNHQTRDFERVKTKTYVRDLTDHEGLRDLDEFDVITEHFLTSVLDKRIRDQQIMQTRRNYARLLKPGGRLLIATGITFNSTLYSDFLQLHREMNLNLIETETKTVWDPYGMDRDDIVELIDSREDLRLRLDNTLLAFEK